LNLYKKTLIGKKAVFYGSAENTFDCPVIVLPIAIAFRGCADLVICNCVTVGLQCTHSSKDGIDGSFIQALATQELFCTVKIEQFEPIQFIKNLTNAVRSIAMRTRLLGIISLLEKIEQNPLLDQDNQFAKYFSQDNITHAFESCSLALWFFVKYYKNPLLALAQSIKFGNEPHSIGALVGALLGALYGTNWIPCSLYEKNRK